MKSIWLVIGKKEGNIVAVISAHSNQDDAYAKKWVIETRMQINLDAYDSSCYDEIALDFAFIE
jgi:hypothetical protein